ncbi:phage integrase SAM-like domain-containing protein [Mucilaginibacter sp. KACC 22773]|uniref:site-specific integrase n=1 Tax=Mucilaginibacter sp. KACC 22773 TaxID=3025671 RepID=UPI002367266E|nr:site-specific integrase [Mucilaginibacter sp. KACC 22773]WDF79562.1 phage integrase SAM-like domain-containing protein [Mucilaginibacter sp. KACC 22773]
MGRLRHNYSFRLEQKTEDVETAIRVWFVYNNKTVAISTGVKIRPKYWDEEKKPKIKILNKPKTVELTSAIETLGKIEVWIIKAFDETCAEAAGFPAPEDFRQRCKEYITGNGKRPEKKKEVSKITLFDYIEKMIEDTKSGARVKPDGSGYAEDSHKPYSSAYGVLKRFATYNNKKSLVFEDVTMAMYLDLKEYCYEIEKLSDNYFGAVVKFIKTAMNEAKEEKLHTNEEHNNKRFLKIQVDVENVYLDEGQLVELAELDLSENTKLERVRDLFLVGCWTGLRFSDFNNIKPENIQGDFIEIKTQKTGELVSIPIHKTIFEIMARYKGKTVNSLPPPISNVKLNEYVKEVGEKAGFKQLVSLEKSKAGKKIILTVPLKDLITTHTARRAFASNMFKAGIPSIIIMGITGHTTEKSFLNYIKVTSREKAIIMKEMWARKEMKAV